MPVAAPASPSPDEEGAAGRHRWLLPGLGALAAVSAVIAAVVIVASGGQPEPAAAAQGQVLVEYHPIPPTDGYSRQGVEAWAAVLQDGSAVQAMAFHGLLFDRQPRPGGTPPILLDGRQLEPGTGTGLADRLRRQILED